MFFPVCPLTLRPSGPLQHSPIPCANGSLEEHACNLWVSKEGCIGSAESDDLGLGTEWRYYKDGKSWLCKITRKKKTVVWMSAWQDHLSLGFYFTEKTGAGISELEIDPALKEIYATAEPIGRLKPLTVDLKASSQLQDLGTLLQYKISKL